MGGGGCARSRRRRAAPSAAESSATGVRPVAIARRDHRRRQEFLVVQAHRPCQRRPATDAQGLGRRIRIDQFILANLEKNGLKPAPPANKTTLLRRATFDLTGLPPTEKEIHDFLADKSPKAFEKVVDRLLASPRYGERWGRQWLDVMRYADSTGSDEDHRYPHAWRYRDYVVQAFNDDMPYNQFVREQLAGDILAADPKSGVGYRGIVATGFLALGKKALAQKDLPLKRYDVVDDQIDVTAKAFLGLTVTCARCHDHKFDPIATKDYYSMAAIFASTLSYEKGETGDPIQTPLAPAGEYEAFRKQWSDVLDRREEDREDHRFRQRREEGPRRAGRADPGVHAGRLPRLCENGTACDRCGGYQAGRRQLARWVEYLKVQDAPGTRQVARRDRCRPRSRSPHNIRRISAAAPTNTIRI